MEAAAASLRVEDRGEGVIALWLDRPGARNALDGALVSALREAFTTPDVRAFVLGSSDPGWFCSGADLSLPDAERALVSEQLYDLYRTMLLAPPPIVVAIGGAAIGGGAQLAIAGDLRVAAPSAWLRFPGAGHGLSVGAWGLPSLAGRGRAMEMCLSMRRVPADEAARIGLIDRLEPDAGAAACELAAEIAQLAPEAAARVKAVARTACGLLEALEAERAGNASWSGSVGSVR